MSDAGPPAPQSVEAILAEFDSRKETLDRFCAKTRELIEVCLDDAQVRYHSIQARVKKRDKLRTKYLNPHKAYRSLDDITDLAALRVITYYDDEIDAAAEVIRREFDIDEQNSVDKRSKAPDKFGYHAVHYVCRHSPQRLEIPEYKKFSGVKCEIQVTSILSHTWAEIEHEWYDLGGAFPDDIKRRFYRMAALLDIAESEFRDLRKARAEYERSVEVRVEAEVPEIPLDEISVSAFIEQEPLVGLIDESLAAELGGLEVVAREGYGRWSLIWVTQAGLRTILDLRAALEANQDKIIRFVRNLEMPATVLPRGFSVTLLGMMLTALKGASEFAEGYYRASGMQASAGVLDPHVRAAQAAVQE